ncbi:DUF317 domain-containing protein [Streptomyces phytophilus]|uniref:DUF317 domain-containing protein n=1 Tax=Streptomyces phytophilus TaxID=722715 RepID=UPI0015F0229F|nr:DUF317 domain-containing protein [Streptomyces phytophilus]
MTPAIDAHVRLDTHPTHPSAVTATLSGDQAHIPCTALEAANWTACTAHALVLARIDHEEPYWAKDAARHLIAEGITVEITPRLQEAMDEEWTWPDYPMPRCTRSEIREVSDQAQKIFDDIRHGQLLIHAHARDGNTTVAIGTYLHPVGKSVYLEGEDHLRLVAGIYDSPAKALLAFEKVHGAEMRPGPAPLTDTERAALKAHSAFEPSRPEPVTVPVYLADTGDHDTVLNTFLDAHDEFEKWRTWSDETTHAIHESQTLRIEHVHETPAHGTAWTVAAYQTPVSDRMWVLNATGATPAPVLQELLTHLAAGDGWDTATGTRVDEKTATAATQPLSDAGWKRAVEGRWIRWTSPDEAAGLHFDAVTAQHPNQNPATWTIWAGPGPDRPAWTITASAHTPSPLLASLCETLAHTTGTHHAPPGREHRTRHAASAPAGPPVTAGRPATHSR